MTPDIPSWVLLFERLGPGLAILVFVLATLWKIVPSLLKLMASWKKQADIVSAAVPRVESSLEQIARGLQHGFQRLEDKFDATISTRSPASDRETGR